MAMNLEIAQFDSTDSWEDRTLNKLNQNFRQVQGGFDFLQESVFGTNGSPAIGGSRRLLWQNSSVADQGEFVISLPWESFDLLQFNWRLTANQNYDHWYTQLVPYQKNFVLTQVSGPNATPTTGTI